MADTLLWEEMLKCDDKIEKFSENLCGFKPWYCDWRRFEDFLTADLNSPPSTRGNRPREFKESTEDTDAYFFLPGARP